MLGRNAFNKYSSSTMDLVPSRTCNHAHWRRLPDAKLQFCLACGFCLLYGAVSITSRPQDIYAAVQKQPRSDETFNVQWSPQNEERYRRITRGRYGLAARSLRACSGPGTGPLERGRRPRKTLAARTYIVAETSPRGEGG